ncbi:MAG TPA: TetR/AcrR family transcriptional regulator [Kofleriaceae bacterium]|nr:TetR/AcrR family transcriptional regulator [Kofleriaceae bacterium]
MAAPSPKSPLATPEHILVAATRLFAAAGYGGTSLQDVADAVGIRKQSLLYHFPSKDELRRRVLDTLLSRWNDVLPRLLFAATSGEGQFDAIVAETIRFFAEDADRARLLLREILDRPADVQALIDTHVAPWVEVVCGYIRKGAQRGEIAPDVDPHAYVLGVIHLILSAIATADCFGRVADRGRQLGEVLRIAKSSLFLARTAASPPEGD